MKHTKLMLGMLLLTSLTVVSQEPQEAQREGDEAALRVRPFFRDLFVNHMLQVEGTTELNGQTYINGNLVVNGTETINGTLVVNGPVTFSSETITGNLNVTGCINAACETITDNLLVKGAASIASESGYLCVGSQCDGFIDGGGNGFLASLKVGGYAGETGDVQISGNANIAGYLCVGTNCDGYITTAGRGEFTSLLVYQSPGTGDAHIQGNLQVDGCITSTCITAGTSLIVSGTLITANGITALGYIVAQGIGATYSVADNAAVPFNTNVLVNGVASDGTDTIVIANSGIYDVSWMLTTTTGGDINFQLVLDGTPVVNTASAISTVGDAVQLVGQALINVTDDGARLQLKNTSGFTKAVTLVSIGGTNEAAAPASIKLERVMPAF